LRLRDQGLQAVPRQDQGQVERFNGYLRRSFYVPLASQLCQSGKKLDVLTANSEVTRGLREVAHQRTHGTTGEKPAVRLQAEAQHLQPLPPPWRADITAARPQALGPDSAPAARPAAVAEHLDVELPTQHSLAAYEQVIALICLFCWPPPLLFGLLICYGLTSD
jgi:hypothetical protein